MQSMTYGVLPTREQFDEAFERECPNGYRIALNSSDSRVCDGFKLGDGKLTADQLWEAVNEIVTRYNTEPEPELGEYVEAVNRELRMDLVSSIMFTLDFEWI